jgi:NAD(P)H-dependent flavin oxidoreductase YrpB (nitropropane dioxygenase family)
MGGGVSTPALAAAVAGAGGLGMLGAAGLSVADLTEQLAAVRAAAPDDGVVGVNFLMPFLDQDAFDAAADLAPIVECFYGFPDPELVDRAHSFDALVSWQVGDLDEALAAEAAGCDLLVVQGNEAGGHVRGTKPLLPLIASVRSATELPLVAAGGIGSGAALAAVLREGADAGRIGTCLLATPEADVHPAYVDALVRAGADDTVLTNAFSFGWPGAPHRVLRSCVDASDADPSTRLPMPPTRSFGGLVEAAALYAGTSVADIFGVEPAANVVRRLVADAEALLAGQGIRNTSPPRRHSRR